MIELWPFQKEAVHKCRAQYKMGRKRLILCSPTGSGKTIMGSWLVKAALERGRTVTVLVDRKELLTQFYKALSSFGVTPTIVDAGSKPMKSQFYLGMVESYYSRAKRYPHLLDVDFMVCDEAHSTSYWKLFKLMPNCLVLGLTASPVLTGTKARLNEVYDDIVELAKVEDLIRDGFLVDSVTYSVPTKDSVKPRKKNGEFTEEFQMEALANSGVYQGALEQYKKLCDGKKFLCYNVNVEHSMEICNYFNAAGVPCAHVDGSTPKDVRAKIFNDFREGKILGIHNFGICTTGYDEPSVECVIQNFWTNSLAKAIQTAGRGARLYPGKEKFYILDMGQNYSRHGLWNTNKKWKEIFHEPYEEIERQQQQAIANVACTTCGYIIQEQVAQCPICNTPFSKIAKDRKAKTQTAAELKLIKAQLESRLPVHLQNRKTSSMTRRELVEYAEHMGYNQKWVFVQLRLRHG